MPYIRQEENGKTIGYASIAPPSAETELWIEVAYDDLRVTEYLNPTPPEMTLARAIAQTQAAMQVFAESLLAQSVAGYSDVERDTWANKEKDAIAFLLSGNPADAPYLLIEANAAAIPLAALAALVSNKASMLQAFISHILGNRARHYQALAIVQTVEEALNYDFSTGWVP